MKEQILIEDMTASEAQLITESSTSSGDTFLNGIFMESETMNRNQRMYSRSDIAKAVNSLNETILVHGGVISEMDHPRDRLTTEMEKACAVIKEVKMHGKNAVGKMKLIDTPCGSIVKEIIKAGYRPGLSSRGSGRVNADGMVEGFTIQTVDVVVTPSARGAVPETMYESIQDMKSGRKVLSLAESLQHDKAAQKYFEREILKFIEDLTRIKKGS